MAIAHTRKAEIVKAYAAAWLMVVEIERVCMA
jgi:hypothetical protein